MAMLSKKILVVDDEESIREIMEINLVKLGYVPELAKNAKEALEILEEEKFPLIITDLKMPEMDGIELCMRIRERTSETLIYAFSGGFTVLDSDHFEKMGFDGLLCKPVKYEVLERAIEDAFKKIDERKGKVFHSPI
ncbi:MAG: response regulator [Desulfobacterales bacterium]|jgi:CheY-like chemotaxis protein